MTPNESKQVKTRILQRQLTLAYFYLRDLQELIQKAGIGEFSSAGTSPLLNLLVEITDILKNRLDDCNEKIRLPLDEEANVILYLSIRGVAMTVVKLASFIKYIEGSSVHFVPSGLVGQLHRICRRFDPTIQLLVRPRFSFAYDHLEARSALRETVMSDPDIEPLLDSQPLYLILSFPKTQRNNMLQQAVWGHEIAHALDRVLVHEIPDTADFIKTLSLYQDELTLSGYLTTSLIEINRRDLLHSLLNHIVESNDPKNSGDPLGKDYHSIAQEQLAVAKTIHNWVTEIVCDLLAIRLFGPAILFALSEIVEPLHNLGSPSDTHPPAAMRIKIMIDELDQLGFIDLSNNKNWSRSWGGYGSVIGEELSRLRDLSTVMQDGTAGNLLPREAHLPARIRIAYEALMKDIHTIRSFIGQIKRDYFLSADKLQEEASALVGYLELDIPPNKPEAVPEPASLPAILNAGWIHWLKLNQDPDSLTYVSLSHEREKLNRLVLKAIESTEIQSQYMERKLMAFRD